MRSSFSLPILVSTLVCVKLESPFSSLQEKAGKAGNQLFLTLSENWSFKANHTLKSRDRCVQRDTQKPLSHRVEPLKFTSKCNSLLETGCGLVWEWETPGPQSQGAPTSFRSFPPGNSTRFSWWRSKKESSSWPWQGDGKSSWYITPCILLHSKGLFSRGHIETLSHLEEGISTPFQA